MEYATDVIEIFAREENWWALVLCVMVSMQPTLKVWIKHWFELEKFKLLTKSYTSAPMLAYVMLMVSLSTLVYTALLK